MPAVIDVAVESPPVKERPVLAPWQHTLFLVGVLVLWAIYGAMRSAVSASAMPLTVRYISSIVMQALLAGSTLAGVYNRREFLFGVFGSPNMRQLSKDLLHGGLIFIAGLVLIVSVRLVLKFTPLHGTYRRDVVRGMLPQSSLEVALWIVVGIVAGTCEEFIFRGYLQKQLTSWFRNTPLAVIVSAIFFGCMHFYQGFEGVVAIAALSALYGICASRLESLRGVMIAHSLEDITAGLVHFFRHA